MTEMVTREYTPEDYDPVIRLWIACGLIKNAGQATQEQLLDFCENGTFLLYNDDSGRIIGTVMGAWDGWRGWIYKLAVAEERRRKGVGTQLLSEVTRRLRGKGARIIRAYVESQNAASLALFKRQGYELMADFVIVTQGRQ